jgi:phosphatidylglycerophosphate synthase
VTTTVVLALTSTTGGDPACLEPGDQQPLLTRLVDGLRPHGQVLVVTWRPWASSLRSVLATHLDTADRDPGSVEVVAVDRRIDVLRWLESTPVLDRGAGVAFVHGHLVADDLALSRLVDAGAGGTGALVVGAAAQGAPVRVTRGRIVAAGSPYHAVRHPSAVVPHGLRIGPADLDALREWAGQLASLLEGGTPGAWRLEAARRATGPGAAGGEDADGDEDAGPAVDSTEDLVSLLLVAAVRSGRHLAAIPVPRGCVWILARGPLAAEAALAARRRVLVEHVRLDAAVKAEDGFFTTFFVSSYSRYWARWAARRGFTPNQVTTASMLLGAAAAAAFAVGSWGGMLLGAVLLQLAFTLDCVDGQLARYSRRFSAFGAWLDSIFDRGKEYLVLAGLAVGGVRAGDEQGLWLLAGAALALQVFRHTLDLGYAEQQIAEVAAGVAQPLEPVEDRDPSFWEPVATVATTTAAPADAPTTLARRAIGALRRAEAVRVLRWGKRIVVLPIGERFLLISVLAVVSTPRVVFLALLLWGGAATLYTFGGRLIRSVA